MTTSTLSLPTLNTLSGNPIPNQPAWVGAARDERAFNWRQAVGALAQNLHGEIAGWNLGSEQRVGDVEFGPLDQAIHALVAQATPTPWREGRVLDLWNALYVGSRADPEDRRAWAHWLGQIGGAYLSGQTGRGKRYDLIRRIAYQAMARWSQGVWAGLPEPDVFRPQPPLFLQTIVRNLHGDVSEIPWGAAQPNARSFLEGWMQGARWSIGSIEEPPTWMNQFLITTQLIAVNNPERLDPPVAILLRDLIARLDVRHQNPDIESKLRDILPVCLAIGDRAQLETLTRDATGDVSGDAHQRAPGPRRI